jgi:hypothetical protein
LRRWWKVVRDRLTTTVDELAGGDDWPIVEALLALHAIADEACAGLGPATAVAPGPGVRRSRSIARELLAERNTLSLLPPGVVRVLPRCRTGLGGMSINSLSRHACVRGPQVDVDWHRMLCQPAGVSFPEAHANIVLLPWPLRVRARDFRAVPFTLPHMDETKFGFFAYQPAEPLDLDLVDDVLRAAADEAGTVDVVLLPEAAITPTDIEPLEALLAEHGIWFLLAGVRQAPTDDRLGENWVHIGVRQELVWRHAVQHKHHRWCLDGRQIKQYHLGGALSADMRWWEAASIPRRSLQIIDQGPVTIAPLICEDLARLQPVADLLRAIGPTVVISLLLDGPQLASRWTARYASVLADDPGSAVLTLTSAGMVRRCRPAGCSASNVIALWKDATGELTEISLDDGAQAVLVSTNVVGEDCFTADGRHHPGTASVLTLAAVQPVRVGGRRTQEPVARRTAAESGPVLAPLDEAELSKATSWTQAVAEAAVIGRDALRELMDTAVATDWRRALGLPPPTRMFLDSVAALRRELPDRPTSADVLAAARRLIGSDDPVGKMTGVLVEIALGQRFTGEAVAGRLSPAELDRLLTACPVRR